MKIIIFSDVHYYSEDIETAKFSTTAKLVQYSLPLLRKLTKKINNEYMPNISVNLGDLIQAI